MFRGSSHHTIDAKGRIIIPARFRDHIKSDENSGVMVSAMDSCLFAYPFEEWHKIENKILSLAETNEYMRQFRRVFIGGAFECLCDKQERILIPPTLRQQAELEKEIALVGVLRHFEIWSLEKWEKQQMALQKNMQKEELRNEIAKLGI
jgi:transcriptional regulator MraZ